MTAIQIDAACQRGERVTGVIEGRRRRISGVNFKTSTRERLIVTLWNFVWQDGDPWFAVDPATIRWDGNGK